MALTHQCLWWLPGIAPVLLCWMRISFLQLTLCLSVRLSHVFVLGYNLQACIACMQPPMKRIALHHLCHEVDVTRCEGCTPAAPSCVTNDRQHADLVCKACRWTHSRFRQRLSMACSGSLYLRWRSMSSRAQRSASHEQTMKPEGSQDHSCQAMLAGRPRQHPGKG